MSDWPVQPRSHTLILLGEILALLVNILATFAAGNFFEYYDHG
jgi:hypothetical protein